MKVYVFTTVSCCFTTSVVLLGWLCTKAASSSFKYCLTLYSVLREIALACSFSESAIPFYLSQRNGTPTIFSTKPGGFTRMLLFAGFVDKNSSARAAIKRTSSSSSDM